MQHSSGGVLGFFAVAVLCLSSVCALASDDPGVANLKFFSGTSAQSIQGLSLSEGPLEVRVENQGSPDQKVVAILKGSFDRKDWALIGSRKLVIVSRSHNGKVSFSTAVPLTGRQTVLRLWGVGPNYNEFERAAVVISYPQFVRGSQAVSEIPSLGEHWNIGLGLTTISYTQTSFAGINEVALTPKILYQEPLSDNWDIGGSVFMTAATLSTSQSGVSASFLGVNARIGYRLPFIPSPFSLSIATGLYYTTMFTSGETFGFQNMIGPQVFPVLRLDLSHGNSMGAYFKYSPVTSPSSVGFASHEFATGLAYTHLLPGGHSVSVTFDYSYLQVNVAGASATSTNVTIGASYGF